MLTERVGPSYSIRHVLVPMLAVLFGAVSLLYATVGQAGGTAFLASAPNMD
jgi:hypothetical protein